MTLDELEQLAKAATPGPWWGRRHFGLGQFGDNDYGLLGEVRNGNGRWHEDTQFIAAANPSTILQLIRDLRALMEVEPLLDEKNCFFCGYIADDEKPAYEHHSDCPWYLAKQRWM